MSVLHTWIGRRPFLSSTLVGVIGTFLRATAARAGTARSVPGSAEALSPAPAPSTNHSTAVAETSVISAAAMAQASGETSVRPFKFTASDEDLADLKRRVAATRWPDREQVRDDSQGVRLDTIQKLARYWATEYDWRKVEARLNALPNFITNIDGLDIHFIHVRSKHENALPMIVTHGWPGSIIEQLKVIDPLTDPTGNRDYPDRFRACRRSSR
jgi:hypothetical protein